MNKRHKKIRDQNVKSVEKLCKKIREKYKEKMYKKFCLQCRKHFSLTNCPFCFRDNYAIPNIRKTEKVIKDIRSKPQYNIEMVGPKIFKQLQDIASP